MQEMVKSYWVLVLVRDALRSLLQKICPHHELSRATSENSRIVPTSGHIQSLFKTYPLVKIQILVVIFKLWVPLH